MQSTLKEWHNLKWLSGLNRQQPFPSPEWKPSYSHQLQPPPNPGISCDGNMLCKGYENHLFEQRVYLLKVRKYAPKRKPDRFQPSLFRGWQPTIHFSQQKDLRISGAWGKPPHFFRHTHYVGNIATLRSEPHLPLLSGTFQALWKSRPEDAQYPSRKWSYQLSSGYIWVGPKSSYSYLYR